MNDQPLIPGSYLPDILIILSMNNKIQSENTQLSLISCKTLCQRSLKVSIPSKRIQKNPYLVSYEKQKHCLYDSRGIFAYILQ